MAESDHDDDATPSAHLLNGGEAHDIDIAGHVALQAPEETRRTKTTQSMDGG